MYEVTKTYGHERGLSATFRQHRATHSHCSLLHGYALAVTIVFQCHTLDERNWVIDFGGLDWVKTYLEYTFDHKTLVADDDPAIGTFRDLADAGLIEMVRVPRVGCESFAEMIYYHVQRVVRGDPSSDARGLSVKSVTVAEHGANSATFRG